MESLLLACILLFSSGLSLASDADNILREASKPDPQALFRSRFARAKPFNASDIQTLESAIPIYFDHSNRVSAAAAARVLLVRVLEHVTNNDVRAVVTTKEGKQFSVRVREVIGAGGNIAVLKVERTLLNSEFSEVVAMKIFRTGVEQERQLGEDLPVKSGSHWRFTDKFDVFTFAGFEGYFEEVLSDIETFNRFVSELEDLANGSKDPNYYLGIVHTVQTYMKELECTLRLQRMAGFDGGDFLIQKIPALDADGNPMYRLISLGVMHMISFDRDDNEEAYCDGIHVPALLHRG